jgi:hypothetical protein
MKIPLGLHRRGIIAQPAEARWRWLETLSEIGYSVMKVIFMYQEDPGTCFS